MTQVSGGSNANYHTAFLIYIFNADDADYIGDAEVNTTGAYLSGESTAVSAGCHLLLMD